MHSFTHLHLAQEYGVPGINISGYLTICIIHGNTRCMLKQVMPTTESALLIATKTSLQFVRTNVILCNTMFRKEADGFIKKSSNPSNGYMSGSMRSIPGMSVEV